MMGAVFVIDLVVNALWMVVRGPYPRREAPPEHYRLGWGPILFSLLIWAPLIEELVFRYVLVGALYDVSPVLAIGMSGVLFGLVHTRGPLPKIVMGCLFAWLYAASGSLWVPIALHAGWNALVVIAGYDAIDTAIRRARGY
jgi:membrane protease YdiL (CAAX protease family)